MYDAIPLVCMQSTLGWGAERELHGTSGSQHFFSNDEDSHRDPPLVTMQMSGVVRIRLYVGGKW